VAGGTATLRASLRHHRGPRNPPLQRVPMAVSSLTKDFTPSGFFMPADVESVITTSELSRRPARAADHAAENQAVLALMDEMASATGIAGADRVLQKLD